MIASASTLPREVEVQSKIRKIRAFGRSARVVCSALFTLGFVGGVLLMLAVTLTMVFGPTRENFWDDGDWHDVMRTVLTPLQFNVWVFFILSVVLSVWLGVLRQLERLFGNLAVGSIYASENVRRLRNAGLLCLVWPLLDIVLPVTHFIGLQFIEPSVPIDLDGIFLSVSELLGLLVTPGLVLLASWIMDVGLHAKEHADRLERDAELTI